MMYVSSVHGEDNTDYLIAVVLDKHFLEEITLIDKFFSGSSIPIESANVRFPTKGVRLIERGFNFYEDRQVYSIPPCEDPVEYYGYHVGRGYEPLEDFWGEVTPGGCYIHWAANSIGFQVTRNYNLLEGYGISLSEWHRLLE